jgi:hypothetical protein
VAHTGLKKGNAIVALLRAQKIQQVLWKIRPYRLTTFVREVHEQIGDSLEKENLRACYYSFRGYLRDLLESMAGVVKTSYDIDSVPGYVSANQLYWVKYADRVAKAVLRIIEEEAKSLLKLT